MPAICAIAPTRARPKIDRIACPWLIRRLIDPSAVFLFVTASEVEAVGERFGAVPFDIEGVYWSHRLSTVVRAAETDRLELPPEAPGLLAASLGLSRIYAASTSSLVPACCSTTPSIDGAATQPGRPITGLSTRPGPNRSQI